ncbi:YgjV family protein [Candidatus Kaiserbacteria bacterium]|nr:YgjV family protein [Candidatus Kaiserbacteria bacterium]
MNIFWIAQGIGTVALVIAVFSYQGKTRNQILNRQIVSSSLFIIHFALLSAWTGALTNVIVVARNWVFARKEIHAWAKHTGWVLFFCIVSVGTLYFSWQGFISLLPVTSVLLGIYARWQEKAAQIRAYGLVGCLLWIPYTIVVHSYAGTLTQLVIAGGIIFGIFQHDWKEKFQID